MRSQQSKISGFTLLEVLVAISVFSMIAIVSYTTLDTYIDHRQRLSTHYGKLERLQRLFILLERDIQFIVNRKVRLASVILPAVMSGEGDVFLTVSVAEADINSASGTRLKRVQWRLEDREMIRASSDVLDHDGDIEASELVVSEEVDDIELSYLMYDPNRGVEIKSKLSQNEFPDGIEVNLTLESGEHYRRVFSIAKGG